MLWWEYWMLKRNMWHIFLAVSKLSSTAPGQQCYWNRIYSDMPIDEKTDNWHTNKYWCCYIFGFSLRCSKPFFCDWRVMGKDDTIIMESLIKDNLRMHDLSINQHSQKNSAFLLLINRGQLSTRDTISGPLCVCYLEVPWSWCLSCKVYNLSTRDKIAGPNASAIWGGSLNYWFNHIND